MPQPLLVTGGGRSPNWHQTVTLQLQPGDNDIAVQVWYCTMCLDMPVMASPGKDWMDESFIWTVVWAYQVFNYSKLGSHDEVARAAVSLPSKSRQGDRQWEQRVAMQPVAKKGALWGGEVFLRMKYASPQVCWAFIRKVHSRLMHKHKDL